MTEAKAAAGKRWIAAILKRARDQLAEPDAWLRNGELADCVRAADQDGRGCVATAPEAARWTANAAIEWAAHTLAHEAGIDSPDRVYRAAGLALQTVNTFAPILRARGSRKRLLSRRWTCRRRSPPTRKKTALGASTKRGSC